MTGMDEAFNKAAALFTDLVTRLEIVDHTPCQKCTGLGWFYRGEPISPSTYKGPFHEGEKPTECENCHGLGYPGRSVVFWDKDKQIKLSLQDQERTLKIFISERHENH